MQTTTIAVLVAAAALGQSASRSPIPKQELEYQQQTFQHWWGQELVLSLDDLPTDAAVENFRVPYSGFDYPDNRGGTINAMMKYDAAYHRGRQLATEYERRDVGNHRDRPPIFGGGGGRRGLFGRLRMLREPSNTRSWYGHCNGWTAAAIRHAEPIYSVTRNGVTFTPADIKGLLAEIYMYTDTEFLGGTDAVIHPALLHLSLTNWLGRGSHPIGVETAVGEVVINYPIYSYKSSVTKHSSREAEVKLTAQYAMNTNNEAQKSPRIAKQMYFHYLLDVDADGKVIGGRYYGDSSRVDMLWAPLKPIQGGQKGNERGNPHVDIKEVLAIWRQSVPEEIRKKWLNIDPPVEDRVMTEEELAALAAAEKPATESATTTATPPANAATETPAEPAETETTSATPAASTPTTEASPTTPAPAPEPATPAGSPTPETPAAGTPAETPSTEAPPTHDPEPEPASSDPN
jgi:hypothetical protein